MKEICPDAKIIVTAESTERALKMYAEGADYVFVPRILAAKNIMTMVDLILQNKQSEMSALVNKDIEMLHDRTEIIR